MRKSLTEIYNIAFDIEQQALNTECLDIAKELHQLRTNIYNMRLEIKHRQFIGGVPTLSFLKEIVGPDHLKLYDANGEVSLPG